MVKEVPKAKGQLHSEKYLWVRPFLIGLFLSSIVLVPIIVAATLVLPLDEWFSLTTPLHPGDWVIYGALVGLVLSSLFGLLFAKSISLENKSS